jgi:hypothetical protein
MLALLIPGKDSVTSEIFDVYMEPLVEEIFSIVVWDFNVRHYKGTRATDIHLASNSDVDNPRFSRICRVPLVWS